MGESIPPAAAEYHPAHSVGVDAGRPGREKDGMIGPAIQRGIEQTPAGIPALLEFLTQKDHEHSVLS